MSNNQSSLQLPLPRPGSQLHQQWGQIIGDSDALLIANSVGYFDHPILVIVPSMAQAYKLEKSLRFFAASDTDIRIFPDFETLAYENFSPHQDIISQRLETLYWLSQLRQGVCIVPVQTAMQRLCPQSFLRSQVMYFTPGQRLDSVQFRRDLEQAGYLHVSQVFSHSEFSIRGSIIDLFPMGSQRPLRIDLFDDEIDSIRYFDPKTQRSDKPCDQIRLLPAREFPTTEQAIQTFRENYLARFSANDATEAVFYQVSRGTMPGGIEYYLPLFFDQTATLFDYVGERGCVFLSGDLYQQSQSFWRDLNERYEQYRFNLARPLLAPKELYLDAPSLFALINRCTRVSLNQQPVKTTQGYNFELQPLPQQIAITAKSKQPLHGLQAFMQSTPSQRTVVVADSQGRRESILELLRKSGCACQAVDGWDSVCHQLNDGGSDILVTLGQLDCGFSQHNSPRFHLITEVELFNHTPDISRHRKKQQATDEAAIIKNLAELSVGQPVVHFEHGVGRFLGLQTLDAGGVETEYLTIEYAKGSKLYVPVSSLHLISRYSGSEPEHAPLHHLGNDTWAKAKRKAAEKVKDVAAQLLDVYAKRAAKPGFAYPMFDEEYRNFAGHFPYSLTPDQANAINAVIKDMTSNQSMDRLVCGDVGFGKTEVAMRAAFIAAQAGKQVAILVPTTLLAQQHFDNFKNRFAQCPFRIEVISRFVTASEQKHILTDLTAGKVDIIIGTHKLIQNDIKFADLGLVIIDEEHRFGVKQKEKFKKLRADVDILTLTATPIPRTLNMALSGMRELSIIATPPAKRLPIKTFVQQDEDVVIREAIMREILRGGQVYYLYNEVDGIEQAARRVTDIVPEARVAIAHGQMRERELEAVMDDFYHQRYNVLVCTTIIETGIDIPTANTIIMHRADHLGLAQMHQLRGRVGRAHHQAYAYLMTPHLKRMTKDAVKRLDAIASLEDLGAGFALATHDLEIRGAGELLGSEQSGQINTIGFSLYMEMLDQAVTALKEGKEPSLDDLLNEQTEVELRISALLPDDYVRDTHIRLSLYKRLASCRNEDEITAFKVDLIDRFGLLPDAAQNLVSLARIKLRARDLGIEKIDATTASATLEFSEHTKVSPMLLIQLIQTQPKVYQLAGPTKLKYIKATADSTARIEMIERLLDQFEDSLNAHAA